VARIGQDGGWSCPDHGAVPPLWQPDRPAYEGFVDHLGIAGGFPTYLPWPLRPGWMVTDFAVVGDRGSACATLTQVAGSTELDGPVEMVIVAEEPGTGLGGRCAGTDGDAPGIGGGRSEARVRVDGQVVALWPVSTITDATGAGEWDRSVVVGEAAGRWLWVVMRPASALLLFQDDWLFRDVSGLGPSLVELPFGEP
jgi:hypothetical protein